MPDLARDVLHRFENWVLQPLRKVLIDRPEENHFIAFVILCVAIDNLASMRYLGDYPAKERGRGVAERYRKFIENYMPEPYHPYASDLYSDYRCKLVHEFQLSRFDIQQSPSSERHHLQWVRGGKICLNSRRLYDDIHTAYEKLGKELTGEVPNEEVLASFLKAGYRPWSHEET